MVQNTLDQKPTPTHTLATLIGREQQLQQLMPHIAVHILMAGDMTCRQPTVSDVLSCEEADEFEWASGLISYAGMTESRRILCLVHTHTYTGMYGAGGMGGGAYAQTTSTYGPSRTNYGGRSADYGKDRGTGGYHPYRRAQ